MLETALTFGNYISKIKPLNVKSKKKKEIRFLFPRPQQNLAPHCFEYGFLLQRFKDILDTLTNF